MEREQEVQLADVYQAWARPPLGLKAGVMPVLALANILARRDRLAVYVDGVFQTRLDDVFVDKLLQKPAEIRLRRIDHSERQTGFLHGLAQCFGLPVETSPLELAQTLFRRFEELPPYVQRTETLSARARQVRGAVLPSQDPEGLFFDALPEALEDALSAETVFDALVEAELIYPKLLDEIRTALAKAVKVDAETVAGLTDRTAAVTGLTNDWAFDGFIRRAAAFESGDGDIEALAGLLLHKPPRNWSDRDRGQALLELVRIGRRFRELEALARVRGRATGSEAVALVVGLDADTPITLKSFELTLADRASAAGLAERLLQLLGCEPDQDLRLAALARAVASVAAEDQAA
jgi:hypothetical protein